MSQLLGNAAIPMELWGVVLASALVAWGLAEIASRLAWRGQRPEAVRTPQP
jgi:Ca2+-transporting ATPase